MDTEFVTAFSADGFRQYGHRLVDTFKRYNPNGRMVLYLTDYSTSNAYGTLVESENLVIRHQEELPAIKSFLEYYQQDPIVCGRMDNGKWSEKEKQANYSYRFDAYKFCRMVLVMKHAANLCKSKAMVWLDGDNVVRTDIPSALASKALGDEGNAYAYLGRGGKHTETGFLVFQLPDALPIVDTWGDYYERGDFLLQKEWHSAFLFDRAREKHPEIQGNDLTPGGRGHVIHQCWVGTIFDHCKGNRKVRGRSPEAR